MVGEIKRDWAPTLPQLLVIAIFGGLCFAPQLFNDGDTSWHLATGQWIVGHRAIPHVDPFSFTFRGHPWTAHEWLVDAAMAVAYAARGWAALALLFATGIATTLWLIARELSRWLQPPHTLAAIAVVAWVLSPFMLARPHVATWPLLVLWTNMLLRARADGGAPSPAWALLILLWANLHASFIFAILLAGFFAFEALVEERGRRTETLIRWGLFGALCLLAALITPHGIQGFLYPLQVSGMKALPLITEWRATDIRDDWPFVLFSIVALAVVVLRWRQVRTIRLLLLAILAELAFAHVRHQPLFAIVATLMLARPLSGRGEAMRAIGHGVPVKWLALIIALARLAIPMQRGDAATFPATAVAKLPAELRAQPVLNDYSFGGPLILSGIAPYIDGRSDMYGDAFTIDHARMVQGDRAAFERAVRQRQLGWTILRPDAPLAKLLDRDPSWHRAYVDRYAVVHVRRRN